MGALSNVKEVVGHAAEQVSRVVMVKVREAEPLIGVKQVLAHLRLHAHAHDVAPRGDKPTAEVPKRVDAYQAYGNVGHRGADGVRSFGKDSRGEPTQYLRKGQVNRRETKGAYGVSYKQLNMRFIVHKKCVEQSLILIHPESFIHLLMFLTSCY